MKIQIKKGDWVELNNGWIIGPMEYNISSDSFKVNDLGNCFYYWKRNGKRQFTGNRYPIKDDPMTVKNIIIK